MWQKSVLARSPMQTDASLRFAPASLNAVATVPVDRHTDAAKPMPWPSARGARIENATRPAPPNPTARPIIAHWHGTTSASFAVLPYTGHALHSTGALLADGIAPMGGELYCGGLRLVGVSHHYISAMPGTQAGFSRVWNYATVCGEIDEKKYVERQKQLLQGEDTESSALLDGMHALRLKQLGVPFDEATLACIQRKIGFLTAHMQSRSWQLLEQLRHQAAADDTCALPPDCFEMPVPRPSSTALMTFWSWNLQLATADAFPAECDGTHLGTLSSYLDGTEFPFVPLHGERPDAVVRKILLYETAYIRQHASTLFAHAQPKLLEMAENRIQQVKLGLRLLHASLAEHARVQLTPKDKGYLFGSPLMPLVFA